MPTWLQALFDAIKNLLESKAFWLALGFKKGRDDGRREAIAERAKAWAEEDAAALRRVLSVPDATLLRDDELDAELERRGLHRLAGVQTNRS